MQPQPQLFAALLANVLQKTNNIRAQRESLTSQPSLDPNKLNPKHLQPQTISSLHRHCLQRMADRLL